MSVECVACASELDHCHGTLVTHEDGGTECTDEQCIVLDPARHALVIDCTTVRGGCDCAQPAELEFLPIAS